MSTAASHSVATADADYVLSVKYNAKEYDRLVTVLGKGGFAVVAAAGAAPDQLLIFVKLAAQELDIQAQNDMVRGFEVGVTAKDTTDASRLRIIYTYLSSPEAVGGLAIDRAHYPNLLAVFPATDAAKAKPLAQALAQPPALQAVTATYGAEVGLYFEFAKFYITWLGYLSVFGAIGYLWHRKVFSLSYTFINLVWGLLFITLWRARQQGLVLQWGIQHCHRVDDHQQQLARINTNRPASEVQAFDAKRFIKQLAFTPVALGFTAVLVLYQLLCFVIEIFLTHIYDGPFKLVLTFIPTVLIVGFVPILLAVYDIVQRKFIDWEGHDTEKLREKSKVVKGFVLNFLTLYVPLIITLFIYLPFAHLLEPELDVLRLYIDGKVDHNAFYYRYVALLKLLRDFQINQHRLTNQFFFYIVTSQVINLVTKYVVPVIINQVKYNVNSFNQVVGKNDDPHDHAFLQHVRQLVTLPEFDVHTNYRGLVTQYGYLILFGPVWPLAPIACAIFNLITFRLDLATVTLGKFKQPPIPRRVDLIAPWNYALFGLTWIALALLPVVTAFYRHGTIPPKPSGQWSLNNALVNLESLIKIVLLLLVLEHGFLIAYHSLNKLLSFVDIAHDQDFIDTDIKLRRDFYKQHLESKFKIPADSHAPVWKQSTALKALEQGPLIVKTQGELQKQHKAQQQQKHQQKHVSYDDSKEKQRQQQEPVVVAQGFNAREAQADGTSTVKNRGVAIVEDPNSGTHTITEPSIEEGLRRRMTKDDDIITNPDGSLSTFDTRSKHVTDLPPTSNNEQVIPSKQDQTQPSTQSKAIPQHREALVTEPTLNTLLVYSGTPVDNAAKQGAASHTGVGSTSAPTGAANGAPGAHGTSSGAHTSGLSNVTSGIPGTPVNAPTGSQPTYAREGIDGAKPTGSGTAGSSLKQVPANATSKQAPINATGTSVPVGGHSAGSAAGSSKQTAPGSSTGAAGSTAGSGPTARTVTGASDAGIVGVAGGAAVPASPRSSAASKVASGSSQGSQIKPVAVITKDPQGNPTLTTRGLEEITADGIKTIVTELTVATPEGVEKVTQVVKEIPKDGSLDATGAAIADKAKGLRETVADGLKTTVVETLELATKKVETVTQSHSLETAPKNADELAHTLKEEYALFIEKSKEQAKEIATAVENLGSAAKKEAIESTAAGGTKVVLSLGGLTTAKAAEGGHHNHRHHLGKQSPDKPLLVSLEQLSSKAKKLLSLKKFFNKI